MPLKGYIVLLDEFLYKIGFDVDSGKIKQIEQGLKNISNKMCIRDRRVSAKNKDNSGSVLDKFYDAKPNKIDLNKKFGGK